MEKHRYNEAVSARCLGQLKGFHSAKLFPPPKSSQVNLYNRKGDIFFYHFGSAKNNITFRLFCPFLTIPLRIIYSSVLDYPDIPLTDGRMVTLLYTVRNFNAERDNKIHVCLMLLSELLLIMSVISWTVIHRQ
jgi:hypothetical protein